MNTLNSLKKKSQDLRKKIITAINKAGKGHVGGAMSIIDILTVLYYNNNLVYDSGKKDFEERTYELYEIQLKENQWVFMYSDGYYDQFGGPRDKSMGSSRFKKALLEAVRNNKSTMNNFKNYFSEWRGDQEQIDDVLLIGFTV